MLFYHVRMLLSKYLSNGHGDVCVYSLNQIQVFCDNAGFYVEKLEAAKKFRLYLVAPKII